MAPDEPADSGPHDAALARSLEHTGVETLLAQLTDDERLYSRELVEVLFHTNALKACADYRMLQAAILLYEEREADYLHRIDTEIGSGEVTIPEGCTDPEQLAALLTRKGQNPLARFGPDGLTTSIAELGATLCLTPAQAKKMIETGAALRYRVPKTAQLLATGRIDLPRFQEIVARTDNVDDSHLDPVDTALATAIAAREPMSMTRFRAMVDAIVERVDPDGAARRRATATSRRYLRIRPHRDEPGQSRIDGQLPATAAAILDARLEAMIADIHLDDPRTRAQQRADALTALAQALPTLPCDCPDCRSALIRPHAETDTGSADDAAHDVAGVTIPDERDSAVPAPSDRSALAPRPLFHIVINLSTVLGHDNDPAFLDAVPLPSPPQDFRRRVARSSDTHGTRRVRLPRRLSLPRQRLQWPRPLPHPGRTRPSTRHTRTATTRDRPHRTHRPSTRRHPRQAPRQRPLHRRPALLNLPHQDARSQTSSRGLAVVPDAYRDPC
ncbi:DUF222 domain-containing protein [Gordonia otitidis]|nr:DUF222 domain-containing protein [Gordonia otitidis]